MSSGPFGRAPEEELDPSRVVVRDKRRIDPASGQVRAPASAPAEEVAGSAGSLPGEAGQLSEQLAAAQQMVAERTADLQRLQAEFANYRRRVERDRVAMAEQATGAVLATLLPVLDDVERARRHGDLNGGFKAVGEALETITAKLGLEPFGEAGDVFDPTVHEALLRTESPDVQETTAVEVLERGYRLRSSGLLLRPARVAVAEPGEAPADADPDSGEVRPAAADEAAAVERG